MDKNEFLEAQRELELEKQANARSSMKLLLWVVFGGPLIFFTIVFFIGLILSAI